MLFLLNPCSTMAGPSSNLKADEQIIFFTTSAWFDSTNKQWHIPIHGWVFEAEDSMVRKQLIASSFAQLYDLHTTAQTEANFNRRVNGLLADNERGKEVVIRIGNRTYALPASASNGHFKTTLVVSSKHLAPLNKQITITAVLPMHDTRTFTGQVNLITDQGIAVISDIDDTIKVSDVTNRKSLIAHTFYKDFKAAPGMSKYYNSLAVEGTSFHFVSSSPWQLYPELQSLVRTAGFPPASFHLKDFRFKDQTFFNLFKDGMATKPQIIENIINKFPNKRFILIGDSGEQDPEVYHQILQKHPEKIKQILIRNVTAETVDNTRFSALIGGAAHRWQLFTNPEQLTEFND